ncbi:hypothetical protein O0I10_013387 [Lichtheimia ornata]|uniref:Uncharacterized protein n=1 Tax=Lichtheimia ornata TaxID=688661 RepID=A0AAD7XSE3_9FUNG|nr:uncharacterized protein O0I10_013387 [Lichtheimia ornata]KAJ8651186.1 hypothetical protein O0I10_013387 [Lichtheimia ornata]
MKRGVFIRAMGSAWPTAPWMPVSRSSLPIPDFAMSPPAKLDLGVDLFFDDDDQKVFFGLFATLNVKPSHKVLLAKPSPLL